MTKPGKTPKKKTKEKSPQRTEESEYPAMDEETYNRLLRNTIEHTKAELEAKLKQQHKEQLKEVEERLTKKFDDEVRELSQAWDESRGANPTTRDKTWMRDIMTEAVVAANNANLTTQKPYMKKLGVEDNEIEEAKDMVARKIECELNADRAINPPRDTSRYQKEVGTLTTICYSRLWAHRVLPIDVVQEISRVRWYTDPLQRCE